MHDNPEIVLVQNEQQLADALRIRELVFVKEQGISQDLDLDGKDEYAQNVIMCLRDAVIGTGRVVIDGAQATLSRIAVTSPYRGNGYAGMIVRKLEELALLQGATAFELYPHAHLRALYERLGYRKAESEQYEVCGHPLIRMSK